MSNAIEIFTWLIEGKKIRVSSWDSEDYIFLTHMGVFDQRGDRYDFCEYYFKEIWELYDKSKKQEELENMEDYVVWDEDGNREFAYWSEQYNEFYSLTSDSIIALKVCKYSKLPSFEDVA